MNLSVCHVLWGRRGYGFYGRWLVGVPLSPLTTRQGLTVLEGNLRGCLRKILFGAPQEGSIVYISFNWTLLFNLEGLETGAIGPDVTGPVTRRNEEVVYMMTDGTRRSWKFG